MTKQVIIIGAGGHAKVLLDILLMENSPIIGFLDNDPTIDEVYGIPNVGTDEDIIEKIMSNEKKPSETRGVGITNVMERLDLHYNNREVFEIKSKKNEGTHVTIKIPLEDGNV